MQRWDRRALAFREMWPEVSEGVVEEASARASTRLACTRAEMRTPHAPAEMSGNFNTVLGGHPDVGSVAGAESSSGE